MGKRQKKATKTFAPRTAGTKAFVALLVDLSFQAPLFAPQIVGPASAGQWLIL